VKQIELTKGFFTAVDDDVFDQLNRQSWHAVSNKHDVYVAGKINNRAVKLHRVIMGAKPGELVDHINGDTLDNRRCNLRICTPSENLRNRRKRKAATSKYKGVHQSPDRDKQWRAMIRLNGKTVCLGSFRSERAAALAYDSAALEHFGEFANLNFGTVTNP
jgi:hypothetical protein